MRTLCHGTDKLYNTTDKVFLVVECRECKLIRLYPWPEPDEIHQYYPENYWYDLAATRPTGWRSSGAGSSCGITCGSCARPWSRARALLLSWMLAAAAGCSCGN